MTMNAKAVAELLNGQLSRKEVIFSTTDNGDLMCEIKGLKIDTAAKERFKDNMQKNDNQKQYDNAELEEIFRTRRVGYPRNAIDSGTIGTLHMVENILGETVLADEYSRYPGLPRSRDAKSLSFEVNGDDVTATLIVKGDALRTIEEVRLADAENTRKRNEELLPGIIDFMVRELRADGIEANGPQTRRSGDYPNTIPINGTPEDELRGRVAETFKRLKIPADSYELRRYDVHFGNHLTIEVTSPELIRGLVKGLSK